MKNGGAMSTPAVLEDYEISCSFRVLTFLKRRVFQKDPRGGAKNETTASNGKEVLFPSTPSWWREKNTKRFE